MTNKVTSLLILATFFLIGLLQGIGFTTIPSAGNFITSPLGFSFSPEQYGSLFLPMFIGSILSSFFGGSIAKKVGIKTVFSFGQVFNIASMLLFSLTALYLHDSSVSYLLFLTLMLCLGIGFGAVLTSLNSFAFFFFPNRPKTALTALHSCLGIGTALGPLAFEYFLKNGIWWYDGLWIATLYILLFFSALVGFPNPHHLSHEKKGSSKLPFSSFALWGFVAIALLYGICETTFGNWGTIFLHEGKKLSIASAALALSLFWGVLTIGRILTVILSFAMSTRAIYCTLPPIMLLSLVILYPASTESVLLSSFGLAGLGCSAMLPLTIGFAQERFSSIAPLISGVMIGVYMLGFGLASQGVGIIYKALHLPFSTLFALLSGPIIILSVLCFIVTRLKKQRL
ncbi:MAG: MFS transporter [Verrucomicrobia bacterium]|nr:MFS transporter [Verrucomicrobiota bacterium]